MKSVFHRLTHPSPSISRAYSPDSFLNIIKSHRTASKNQQEIITAIKKIVGENNCITDPDLKEGYETGERNNLGKSFAVILPQTSEQVSEVIKILNTSSLGKRKGVGVVVQGGNTGLAKQSAPTSEDNVILSMKNFNKGLLRIDTQTKTVTTTAASTIAEIIEEAKKHGLTLPILFGAYQTAQVGGGFNTNVAGIEAEGYGSLDSMVRSFKTISANGEETDITTNPNAKTSAIKQNNGDFGGGGYAGAAGLYGVITELTIDLIDTPKQMEQLLLIPLDKEQAPQIRAEILEMLEGKGIILSAFEGISIKLLNKVTDSQNRPPIVTGVDDSDYALLLKFDSSKEQPANDGDFQTYDPNNKEPFKEAFKNEESLTTIMYYLHDYLFQNKMVKETTATGNHILEAREEVSWVLKKSGIVLPFDVAIKDMNRLQELVERVEEIVIRNIALKSPDTVVEPTPFGHIGRAALHLNFLLKRSDSEPFTEEARKKILEELPPEVMKEIEEEVLNCVILDFDGTPSAEHGLDNTKIGIYVEHTSEDEQQKLIQKKNIIDPNHIFSRDAWDVLMQEREARGKEPKKPTYWKSCSFGREL